MNERASEDAVLARLFRWAAGRADVRAMLLYSSRTRPGAPVDAFSDYDILLAVTGVRALHEDDGWLGDFGDVLVVFRNPVSREHGFECFGFITHYQDGTKIDYGVYPVEFLRWAAGASQLPADLDDGYRVLLDKDGLTAGLKPPTYSAYQPVPPGPREYRELVEEFFNDAAYVAKELWRDNLFTVKLSLDHIMKFRCLRQMLEWRLGIQHGWSIRPGANGKGLKRRVEPELWSELERTYVGAGRAENWEALYQTVDLFRKVALDVADGLGYRYPHELDRHMRAYLDGVRRLSDAGTNDGARENT